MVARQLRGYPNYPLALSLLIPTPMVVWFCFAVHRTLFSSRALAACVGTILPDKLLLPMIHLGLSGLRAIPTTLVTVLIVSTAALRRLIPRGIFAVVIILTTIFVVVVVTTIFVRVMVGVWVLGRVACG